MDYLSIPQANPHLKQLAIESLAQYASACRYFMIVCPEAVHADTSRNCDATTYSRRGWCRLEQWARLNGGGLEGMYIMRGTWGRSSDSGACDIVKLQLVDGWLEESIHVFEGEFTDPNDKAKVVDNVLALWAFALYSTTRRAGLHNRGAMQRNTGLCSPKIFKKKQEKQ